LLEVQNLNNKVQILSYTPYQNNPIIIERGEFAELALLKDLFNPIDQVKDFFITENVKMLCLYELNELHDIKQCRKEDQLI
jgi:hypothetical protein